MTTALASDEVQLGTTKLKLARREGGMLAYEEAQFVGAEVDGGEAAATQFVDVFTSWHKGAFMPRYVQDGWYFEAENVDCTKPGEIKPGPLRLAHMNFNVTPGGTPQYGIGGLYFDQSVNELVALIKAESSSSGLPSRIYAYYVDDAYTVDSEREVTAQANDVATTAVGFTPIIRAIPWNIASSQQRFLIPCGTEFRHMRKGAISSAIATSCHAILRVGSRYFKVALNSSHQLILSNADAAGVDTAANWTTSVVLDGFDAIGGVPAGPSLASFGEAPIVGNAEGIHGLRPGGFPDRLTGTQFLGSPYGVGNLSTIIAGDNGYYFNSYSGRGIMWTDNFRTVLPVGPSANHLTDRENAVVMDMHMAPNGDLWALIFYPTRAGSDRDWELVCGKKQGPRQFAWHPVLADDNSAEGGPTATGDRTNSLHRPFLAWMWAQPPRTANFAIGTDHGTSTSGLLFTDARMYFDDESVQRYEDHAVNTTVTVRWRSGRYSRKDPRTQRHWTALHFLGKNIGNATLGGRIKVEVSYDGGAFQNPPAGATFLTSNAQTVPLDTIAREVEVQLTWQLDGTTGTGATAMRNAPATVTQIQYEGREIPRNLKLISLSVDAAEPVQAGGVRSKQQPPNLLETLKDYSLANVKLDFSDPYHSATRQVVVLPPAVLSAGDASGDQLPEGSIQLRLLEVPS